MSAALLILGGTALLVLGAVLNEAARRASRYWARRWLP